MIILTFELYLNMSFKLAPMLSFNPGKTNFPSNSFFSDEISKAALLTEFLIEIKYKIKIAAANTAITAKNIFLRVCSGLDLIFSIKLFIGNFFTSDYKMIFFVSGWQWDPLAKNIIKAKKKYHFAIRSSTHF